MSPDKSGNRELLRYLWVQLGPWRLSVSAGILATLVSVGLDYVSPHLIGVLIDGLRTGWGPPQVLRVLSLMLLASLVGAFLLWAQRYLVIRASRAMEHDLRQRLFERLQGMPPSFLDRHPTGDLMTLASSDLDRIRDVLGPALLHLFRTVLSIVFAVAYLLWRDWRLAVWAFLPLALMPFMANRGMMLMHKAYAQIQERISSISTFTRDALAGIQVVKGYGREETFQESMAGLSNGLRVAQSRSAWATGALWPAVTALGGMGMVVLVWHGVDLVHEGKTTVGILSSAVMVFFRLQWPLVGLGWVSSMLQRGATSLSRMRTLDQDMEQAERAEREATIARTPGPRATPPLLEVRNLSFRYTETGPWVLRNVDLRLEPGEGLGIAGGPGSGKTTLLHLISGLRRPPPGCVFADGQDLSKVSTEDAAAFFSLVPQDGFLFSATIAENLALGAPDGVPAPDPGPYLAASCFDQDLPQIPHGLEAVLGERGINLSGGQRQRLALARALVRRAQVLLLDDTLSAVDAQTETRILERLGPQLEGRSLVLTSHRYSAFRFAQRVLVLDKGEVAELGTHDELLELDGYYAEAWRLQALEREIAEA
ncbi:MAG TPA: ABC transporter ATP-binding protein [Fibrobacteria bacterium]|nr:ABC transporter ATP-binding protein [Fibrobacteria bacterium]